MAFKKVNNSEAPLTLDKNNKRVEGFLLGVKPGSKKYPSSRIYTLQDGKGKQVKVWGCASINQALLDGADQINAEFKLRLVRFTFQGMLKIKGRKEPMRDVLVEVDDSRKLKLAKIH